MVNTEKLINDYEPRRYRPRAEREDKIEHSTNMRRAGSLFRVDFAAIVAEEKEYFTFSKFVNRFVE